MLISDLANMLAKCFEGPRMAQKVRVRVRVGLGVGVGVGLGVEGPCHDPKGVWLYSGCIVQPRLFLVLMTPHELPFLLLVCIGDSSVVRTFRVYDACAHATLMTISTYRHIDIHTTASPWHSRGWDFWPEN